MKRKIKIQKIVRKIIPLFLKGFSLFYITFSFAFSKTANLTILKSKKDKYTDKISPENLPYPKLNLKIKNEILLKKYKKAIKYFQNQNYLSALELFFDLLKYPQFEYFEDVLSYLAACYLRIGQKNDIRTFVIKSINILKSYYSICYTVNKNKVKKENINKICQPNSLYYYFLGVAYEVLGFYKKAEIYYKKALENIDKNYLNYIPLIKLGLLRISLFKKDIEKAQEYIFGLKYSKLLDKDLKGELYFLTGYYYFLQGKFASAQKYFNLGIKTFKPYLSYNPFIYFIIAENLFYMGDFEKALPIFIKLKNEVKNFEIVEKSKFRINDIFFQLDKADSKELINNYLTLMLETQDTKLDYISKVSKIKALTLISNNMKYKLFYKSVLEKSNIKNKEKLIEDIEDPLVFAAVTWSKNRNNYIGNYALGLLGYEILKGDKIALYDYLSKELHYAQIDTFLPEHRKFISKLWQTYILQGLPSINSRLYLSNPKFFNNIFTPSTLYKIAMDLRHEGYKKEAVKLFSIIPKKTIREDLVLKSVANLLILNEPKIAYKILKNFPYKSGKYLILLAETYYKLLDFKNLNLILKNIKKIPSKKVLTAYYIFKVNLDFINKGFVNPQDLKKLKDLLENLNSQEILVLGDALTKAGDISFEMEDYKLAEIIFKKLYNLNYNRCYSGLRLAYVYYKQDKLDFSQKLIDNISRACKIPQIKLTKYLINLRKTLADILR